MPVRKRPLLPEPSQKAQSSLEPKPPEAKVEPRLYTLPLAAEYLNTSVWKIRELYRKRMLKPIRFGKNSRVIFIDRADLDAFVEKLKEAA